MVLWKSTPGKFAYICHFQQIGINATKIEKTGIHFKTDVFAAVAVVDAKAPYYDELTVTQSTKSGLKINLSLLPFVLTGQRIFSLVMYLF